MQQRSDLSGGRAGPPLPVADSPFDAVARGLLHVTALYKRLDTECAAREPTKRQTVIVALERYLSETT